MRIQARRVGRKDDCRSSKSFVDCYVITPTQCTSIFARHTFPTFKMYTCTATLIDVESVVTRYGKTHGNYTYTSARVRDVCAESTRVACIIRPRQCSNVVPESLRYYPTAPPSILSVGPLGSASRPVELQRGIQRARAPARAMYRYVTLSWSW